MKHLEGLNEAQKEAVLTTEGPVLVLAGAGAGKTRTIAHRIVHLVKGGTPPHQILAITFTNKAAREMRERVLALLAKHHAPTQGTPTVSTFHALSAMLLRQYAAEANLNAHFTIYDRTDSLRAVKRAIKAADEDPKQFDPRSVLATISRAKGDAKTLPVYREEATGSWRPEVVARVWEHYERQLRKEDAVDFDDLLLLTWKLLRSNEAVRTALQQRYRYIHVDEYQDTNKVQYEIVRLIAGDHQNVFCVGDLDQNVYSWRGATIENILEFEKDFPDATTIRLEQNYRSTNTIVTVSNEIIKKNRRRKEKTLFTTAGDGEKMALIMGYDERNEAEQVVESIAALLDAGVSGSDIAVLYRANFQSRVLEDACLTAGLPYRVLGTRFFDRKEVKDLLAYVRAALNPESMADIERVINTPVRGIGKVTLEKLRTGGRETLTGRTREKVEGFYRILDRIRAHALTHVASETLAFALTESTIEQSLSGGTDEDQERLENVRELVTLASQRYDSHEAPDSLLRLLEDAALATDQDELDNRTDRTPTDAVGLMTVHAAKGLEFAHVFVTGLEDGLFPHERMDEKGTKDTEEERRLFYVALTRAKKKVHLAYAQVRTVFGQRLPRMPSEYVLDIDEKYLEAAKDEGFDREKVVYLDF